MLFELAEKGHAALSLLDGWSLPGIVSSDARLDKTIARGPECPPTCKVPLSHDKELAKPSLKEPDIEIVVKEIIALFEGWKRKERECCEGCMSNSPSSWICGLLQVP